MKFGKITINGNWENNKLEGVAAVAVAGDVQEYKCQFKANVCVE